MDHPGLVAPRLKRVLLHLAPTTLIRRLVQHLRLLLHLTPLRFPILAFPHFIRLALMIHIHLLHCFLQ